MLKIALPSKGRLSDQTLDLFQKAGLSAELRGTRALSASLGPDYSAIFARAADVPEFVADGAADAGVTGADLVAESGQDVEELLDLKFGQCRLVVAAREESEVRNPADLPAGTRIATSFPRLTRTFFDELGVPVEVARVSGSAEIAPYIGVADVIVDLASTGSTLRVNGLREVTTILDSSARLVANREALEHPEKRTEIGHLVAALESVLRAAEKRYLMANVPRDRLDEVQEVLPGISGPTIVDILNRDAWVATHAVVNADEVYRTIARLKELGAEGILVTPIERLMP